MDKRYFADYEIKNSNGYEIQVCFLQNVTADDTIWHIHNPLIQHLPVLGVQLAILTLIMRLLLIVLKPLRQPRFVAELTAGLLMGPSGFGQISFPQFKAFKTIFPFESNMLLESFANIGVTYYMFLVGLEMDLSTVKHAGKKSWSISMVGFFIPSFVGVCLYFIPMFVELNREGSPVGALFWSITLTITSFRDLARTLSDAKLLRTELGRTALTSALINDISTWVYLVAAINVCDETNQSVSLSLVPIICFIIIFWLALRPGIAWMIKHINEKQGKFSNEHICFILMGVILSGLISDACGSHSLVGGFLFGLVIPKGELAIEIMEKTEEFVNGIMLPSYIMTCGLKTNFYYLKGHTKWAVVALITTIATSAKIVCTVFVSSLFGMSLEESLTLGGLMNTKGIFALMVLNEGRNLKALDGISLIVMVLAILFMTSLVGPIVIIVKRRRKRSRQIKIRTIQDSSDAELRILPCIHSVQNLSGIIHLLEVSNATRKSPICVFPTHLVELTERSSAMLIVNDKLKTSTSNSPSLRKTQSDHIFSAFEEYKFGNEAASVHPLTVLSPYTTMHEDIFKLAEDKAVSMILIPFHKQPTADGGLQSDNPSIKEVNGNLLVKAPCSVGILVNRGLGSRPNSFFSSKPELRLAMLFIGGPDDREALSYARRMAGTQQVTLTVVRFRPGKVGEVDSVPENKNKENEISEASEEVDSKIEIDDYYINEFRFKSMFDESITYQEKLVNNSDELEKAVREVYNNFDLYIVGRGLRVKSPLTKGLVDWGDSSELGPIGDTLVSCKFTAHASVLVVQHSTSAGLDASLQRSKSMFKQKKWASPILNPDYDAIISDEKKGYKLVQR